MKNFNFEYLLWDPEVRRAAVALFTKRQELVDCLQKVVDYRARELPAWFQYLHWEPEVRRAAVELFAQRQELAEYLRSQGILHAVVAEMPEYIDSTSLLVVFVQGEQHLCTEAEAIEWSVAIGRLTGVVVDVLPAQGLPEYRRQDYADLFPIVATDATPEEDL